MGSAEQITYGGGRSPARRRSAAGPSSYHTLELTVLAFLFPFVLLHMQASKPTLQVSSGHLILACYHRISLAMEMMRSD